MLESLRRHFHDFLAARSGTRFRRQHRHRQARPHLLHTILAIGAGLLLILLGIVMLVLPGPGLVAILIGAGLIAGESLLVARLLDCVDFHASARYARWRQSRDSQASGSRP